MQGNTDKIPKDHGEIYFEPPFPTWKDAVLRNRELLSKATYWGLSPMKVRAALKLPVDRPLIFSGHQPIFVHPGIWAKCLAASVLAESVKGAAYHKLTDTALAPEYIHYLPELEQDGRARRRVLDFFTSKDMKQTEKSVPYAYMPAPQAAALEKVFADANNYCPPGVKKGVAYFGERMLKGLKLNSANNDKNTWDLFQVHCMGLLDEICGTRRIYLEGNMLWKSDAFTDFLVHWFTHMSELNELYNQSLNEYRRAHGISHEIEPMPNLKFDDWYFETPFWGTNAHHHRDTLWAKLDGKHLLLKLRGAEGHFSFDLKELKAELAKSTALTLWPKAIPQTLFCRMYLCDFFIHGTGGAVYEEVGNRFFEKALKSEAPAFGVVTATYLADAPDSENVEKITEREKALEWWKRSLEKNPEYLFTQEEEWRKELPAFMHVKFKECLDDPELRKAAQQKASQIALLMDPAQRAAAVLKIKELNAKLTDAYVLVFAVIEQGLSDIQMVRETGDALAFREYPFFCFEPEIFQDMRDKIKKAAKG